MRGSSMGGVPPPPTAACLSSAWFPGLDAQLVIRPLMEKVQKKGYDAALRKFTLPHVSAALSRVQWQLLGARGELCGSSRALPALLGPLLALACLRAPVMQ